MDENNAKRNKLPRHVSERSRIHVRRPPNKENEIQKSAISNVDHQIRRGPPHGHGTGALQEPRTNLQFEEPNKVNKMMSKYHDYNDLNSEDAATTVGKHNVPIDYGYSGCFRVLQSPSNHRCPVCGQVAECLTDDSFHNCNLCGSTWKIVNA